MKTVFSGSKHIMRQIEFKIRVFKLYRVLFIGAYSPWKIKTYRWKCGGKGLG